MSSSNSPGGTRSARKSKIKGDSRPWEWVGAVSHAAGKRMVCHSESGINVSVGAGSGRVGRNDLDLEKTADPAHFKLNPT